MRRLLLWHIPVVILWFLLRYYLISSQADWVDKIIVGTLAISFGLSAVVLVLPRVVGPRASRPPWTNQTVALLFTAFALCLLFAGTLWLFAFVIPDYRPLVRAVPPEPRLSEQIVDIVRAYLLVSGPLTVWECRPYISDNVDMFERFRSARPKTVAEETGRLADETARAADQTERLANAAEKTAEVVLAGDPTEARDA